MIKKKYIIQILAFAFLCITPLLLAQNTDYPKRKVNGIEYYVYTVQQSEGLFSISRKFSVTQAEINTLNPEIHSGLKAGQQILIPINKKAEPQKNQDSETKTKQNTADKQEFIEHIVLKKQTLFAISRQYNVSQDEIKKLNPELENGLKTGMIIKIPKQGGKVEKEVKEVTEIRDNKSLKEIKESKKSKKSKLETSVNDTTQFIIHKVKSGETLYSISKLYKADIEQINKLNPKLNSKVKIGSEIKIPIAKNTNEEKKSDITVKETHKSLNSKTSINAQVKPNKEPIRIAFLLPFMLDAAKSDLSTERFNDFYAGALLAINNAKNNAVSFEIMAFDVEKSEEKMAEVLVNNDLKNADFIIGPAYTSQIPYISDFARENRIFTLIPFSSKVNDVLYNPYLFQFNPGIDVQVDFLASTLNSNYEKDNIIFAEIQDINFMDDGNEFALALQNKLDKQNRKYKKISISPDNSSDLSEVTENNKKNIIIFNSDKFSAVSPYLQWLNSYNGSTDIVLFEQYSWKQFDIENFKTISISPFKSINSSKEAMIYKKQFEATFDWEVSQQIPRYDILGYDLTNYFIALIYYNGANFVNENNNYKLPEATGIQSDFDFRKLNSAAGYVNQKLFLIEK